MREEPTQPANHDSPRRREILTAAARAFRQKGFHGATMDDIGRDVGMNKATLYYWVSSKEAILYELLVNALDDLLADARKIHQADLPAPAKVRELVRLHVRRATEIPDVMHLVLREFHLLPPAEKAEYMKRRREYERIWRDALEHGRLGNVFQPKPYNMSIFFILGALNLVPVWYRPDGALTPEQIGDIFADMVLAALGATPNEPSHQRGGTAPVRDSQPR